MKRIKVFLEKKSIIFNISLLLILSLLLIKENYPQRLINYLSSNEPKTYNYIDNINYNRQVELFKKYKQQGEIVMLGNSITYQCNWNEMLDRKDVINRGIVGDVTEGFLKRLEWVIKVKPKVVFIMGGVNDLFNNIEPIDINSNIAEIIHVLKKNNIEPIVQSILYVDLENKVRSLEMNKKIKETNHILKNTCTKNDVDFIDLNNLLGNNDKLKDTYSLDGLHLTAIAYDAWGEILNKVIINKLN